MKNKPALFLGLLTGIVTIICMLLPVWTVEETQIHYSDVASNRYIYNVFNIPGAKDTIPEKYSFITGYFAFSIVAIFILVAFVIIGGIVAYNSSSTGGKVIGMIGAIGLIIVFLVNMIIGFFATGTITSSTYKARAAIGWGEFPFIGICGITIPFMCMLFSKTYNSYNYVSNNLVNQNAKSKTEAVAGSHYVSQNNTPILENNSSMSFKIGDKVYNTSTVIGDKGKVISTNTRGTILSKTVSQNGVTLFKVSFETNGKDVEALVSEKRLQLFGNAGNTALDYNEKVFSRLEGAQRVLDVYEDRVVLVQIQNFRAYLTHNFFKGAKEIPFSSMSSIQFKEASSMILGYIQFEVPGIHSSDNFNSENSWTFYSKDNILAKKVCDYCRKRIMEVRNQPHSSAIQQKESAADEILKYKKLFDMGAITQEEYDKKKKELLEK